MSFSIEDIQKLAQLSRLALGPAEQQQMLTDLGHILDHIESLQQVNIDGVQPMTHAIPIDLPLRVDEAKPGVGHRGLMGSAGYEDGLVRVPKIIE